MTLNLNYKKNANRLGYSINLAYEKSLNAV